MKQSSSSGIISFIILPAVRWRLLPDRCILFCIIIMCYFPLATYFSRSLSFLSFYGNKSLASKNMIMKMKKREQQKSHHAKYSLIFNLGWKSAHHCLFAAAISGDIAVSHPEECGENLLSTASTAKHRVFGKQHVLEAPDEFQIVFTGNTAPPPSASSLGRRN